MARRRRGLTPEEQTLWSRVAKTTTPINPSRAAKPDDLSPRSDSKPRPVPKKPVPRFDIGESAALPMPSFPQYAPTPAQQLAAQPVRMDKKIHKRMSQGKMMPEARLDLHGMTLAQAQPELTRFIMSCQARGHRLVLVITGKGRGDHGPLPTRPGALRHQVPYWLASPPLRSIVQQVNAAHYRHGGEGAYYIYLRRPG